MAEKTSSNLIITIVGLLSLSVIFTIDLLLVLSVSIGTLYIGVTFLSIWAKDRIFIILISIVAILLIVAGYLFSPPAPTGTGNYIAIANRLFAIVIIILCTFLIIKYKKAKGKSIDLSIDVSKKKREADKFKTILESAPDAIVIVDNKGKIHLLNSNTEKLFGYTKKELTGKNVEMLMPSRYRNTHHAHRKSFTDNPKTRPMGEHLELFGQSKDGKEIPIEISLSPLETEDGSLVSAAIRDVTNRKLIEKELMEAKEKAESAMKVKQQFLANMSHEIRTPMTAIIGFTKVVLKTDLTASQREYISAIKKSSDSLLVLINDILDLAKVDAGKIVFEKQPFKMSEEISAMLHLFDFKIKEKNLELVKEYDNTIPPILLGDSVRLNQILINLISNAIKFTSKGKITVSVRLLTSDNDNVTIEFAISDSGIGLAEDTIPIIFENFQQATSSTARLFGGTGLGLAIVKQLVEKQGGTISVKSKLNEGSTFSFILNFQKIEPEFKLAIESETAQLESNKEIKNIKVLVVEDVELNQMLIKIILKGFGFEMDIADNGKVAIEKLQTNSYDIILMDLQMPEMNGFEASEHIRRKMNSNIPIIALTADVVAEELIQCEEIGINAHITKPFDEKLLYNKIVELVGNHNTLQ